jgi:pseudaminic acid cytidylyltransferase
MKTLCIIPARGGSKRIPRKNIKPFLGRPIIEYAIQEAQAARFFTDIVVSTDDPEIGLLARDNGVLWHTRSAENSNDFAVLADVIQEYLAFSITEYDYICTLLPTAVLVDHRHIRSAFDVLHSQPAVDEVMPVVRFGYPIERAVNLSDNGFVTLRQPEHLNSLSNHLPPAYHDAGQFYWMRTASFLAQQKIILDKTIGYELVESEVQDIDTDEDWLIAEIKYGRRLEALKAVAR